MKSYFAINHNPDAKDLKQLSQKTGLPKRVLQVSLKLCLLSIIHDILLRSFQRRVGMAELNGVSFIQRYVLDLK